MKNKTKVGVMLNINDKIGIKELQLFKKEKLGNYVVIKIHWQKFPVGVKTIEKAVVFCVKHNIYFSFSEYLDRYTFKPFNNIKPLTPEEWTYLIKLGGKYYDGSHSICERGGMVYWPLAYKQSIMRPKICSSMEGARDYYEKLIKDCRKLERKNNRTKLECIDSSLLHKYHLMNGMDKIGIEVFPGDIDVMMSAVRGASRGMGNGSFSCDIAHVWYGGTVKDEQWFKRWQLSLYHSYLSGADCIYSETGMFGIKNANGFTHEIDSVEIKRYRKQLKDFYAYTKKEDRPAGGPETRIGILHGKDDGAPGLWNKEVWGQHKGKQWKCSAPEKGWDLLQTLFKSNQWFDAQRLGDKDYSGNPPLGQVDIVPVESPVNKLKSYSCLIFLGWNTMDDETYAKLKKYVKSGGRLLMSLGHLNVETDRRKGMKLFNKGDFSDLFGLKVTAKGKAIEHSGFKFTTASKHKDYKFQNWTEHVDPKFMAAYIPSAKVKLTGAKMLAYVADHYSTKGAGTKEKPTVPALTEYKSGKGMAYLVPLWGYPGEEGIYEFYEEILKVINLGEQDKKIKVLCSDKVRYAAYKKSPDKYIIYILNTDFDLVQQVKISHKGKDLIKQIQPCKLEKFVI